VGNSRKNWFLLVFSGFWAIFRFSLFSSTAATVGKKAPIGMFVPKQCSVLMHSRHFDAMGGDWSLCLYPKKCLDWGGGVAKLLPTLYHLATQK